MRLMGAITKQDAVNTALRECVAHTTRLQAADKLAAWVARGEFDDAVAAWERWTRLRAFEQLVRLGHADAGYEAWRERKGLVADGGQSADA